MPLIRGFTRRRNKTMALQDVSGRTVIVGGGLHAAVVAATLFACNKPRPIVVERRSKTGGIFADLSNFRMNSANGAGIRSVGSPGPTRIPSMSPSDDINWVPNATRQVASSSGMVEYPYSYDMAKLIQETLAAHAQVYTSTEITFDQYGGCTTNDSYIGNAKRVIFAAGLVEPPGMPTGPGIMSGYAFMKSPVRNLAGKKIALVGAGDTASQVAEFMVGQGVSAPTSFPDRVDWFGGLSMPTTKQEWMLKSHARWAGIGRHLPDEDRSRSEGVFSPHIARGDVASLGSAAWVNGEVYDLVVMATGFAVAQCPVTAESAMKIGEKIVAKFYDLGDGSARVFRVGTCASLNATFKPYQSRFPAAKEAIFNLGPRTAAFAGSLS
jgi:hypothetical protein